MSKTFKSADYDNRELMVDACFGEPRLMILTIGDASGANTALTPKDKWLAVARRAREMAKEATK